MFISKSQLHVVVVIIIIKYHTKITKHNNNNNNNAVSRFTSELLRTCKEIPVVNQLIAHHIIIVCPH